MKSIDFETWFLNSIRSCKNGLDDLSSNFSENKPISFYHHIKYIKLDKCIFNLSSMSAKGYGFPQQLINRNINARHFRLEWFEQYEIC